MNNFIYSDKVMYLYFAINISNPIKIGDEGWDCVNTLITKAIKFRVTLEA